MHYGSVETALRSPGARPSTESSSKKAVLTGDPGYNEHAKLEQEMLIEALRFASDWKAVDLSRLLASCFVRPYRLYLTTPSQEHMKQQADDHPGDLDFSRMVKLYQDALKRTPSAPASDVRIPFLLWIVQAKVFVLPLALAGWLFGPSVYQSIFWSNIYRDGCLRFKSDIHHPVARPKGKTAVPQWVKGTFKIIRFLIELVMWDLR